MTWAPSPWPEWTIAEERQRLQENYLLHGTKCRACDQNVKAPPRHIDCVIARCVKVMVFLSELHPDDWPTWMRPGRFANKPPWIHVPTMMRYGADLLEQMGEQQLANQFRPLTAQGGYRTIVHHYGMIIPWMNRGKQRSGWWRIAVLASDWVYGREKIQGTFRTYNNRLIQIEGAYITWDEANRKRFNNRDI